MNIVLFGPPGAGKGTQSQKLIEKLRLVHVSTGDLLREAIKNKTDLGAKAKEYMDKGQLVPDDIMLGLIKEVMVSNSGKGLLLDGFPRTEVQAENLDRMLNLNGSSVTGAIFLDVPKDVLVERLTGRRVCGKCGSTFHVTLHPPKNEGTCDKCSGLLELRKDDTMDVILNRLDVYERNTAPLKQYYMEKKVFSLVDGVGQTQEVLSRILSRVSA